MQKSDPTQLGHLVVFYVAKEALSIPAAQFVRGMPLELINAQQLELVQTLPFDKKVYLIIIANACAKYLVNVKPAFEALGHRFGSWLPGHLFLSLGCR